MAQGSKSGFVWREKQVYCGRAITWRVGCRDSGSHFCM